MIKPRTTVWILAVIAVILIVALGYRAKFAASNGLASIVSSLSPFSNLEERITELESENLSLKTNLLNEELSEEGKIKVFSTYPFNNRSEIAIDGGENLSIEEGDVVVTDENILVGKVKKVYAETSIVTTIFDPTFEIPVRIGGGEVDALAVGGNILMLDLIPKEASVAEGDIVLTADRDLPYGLTLGRVDTVEDEDQEVFKKARVEPGFEIKSLKNVSIYR